MYPMPKMKTHRGAAKRFDRTASGKIKRNHAFKSHILAKKTPKRKRNLRKGAIMHAADAQRIIKLIPYK
jgi:large subunit ribosomal protein L35